MFCFFRGLLAACCVLLLFGCSKEEGDNFLSMEKGRRTVLMYVSAQNSLGYRRYHQKDSLEIERGKRFIADNDRLLVYVDDAHLPRIYRYKKNGKPELVRQWKQEANSSSPATLSNVLSWMKQYYPAEEYGLVMWSHATGWLPSTNCDYTRMRMQLRPETFSFGIDVGEDGNMSRDEAADGQTGAQMNVDDLANAVAQSGVHLKYLFFDACLMQSLEVCYSLRNVTDYVIGGPVQIPACGGNYEHLLEKGLFTQAEKDIVETYYRDAAEGFNDYDSDYYDFGIVLSAVRTDKMETLAQTLASSLARSSLMGRQSPQLSQVPAYLGYSSMYNYLPHMYDAQEAMRSVLQPSDYQAFKAALDACIVSKAATDKCWIGPGYSDMIHIDANKFCGISAFIPQDIYTRYAGSSTYGDINAAFRTTLWYQATHWAVTGW